MCAQKDFSRVYILFLHKLLTYVSRIKKAYIEAHRFERSTLHPSRIHKFYTEIREVNGYSGGEKKGSEKLRWLFFFFWVVNFIPKRTRECTHRYTSFQNPNTHVKPHRCCNLLTASSSLQICVLYTLFSSTVSGYTLGVFFWATQRTSPKIG